MEGVHTISEHCRSYSFVMLLMELRKSQSWLFIGSYIVIAHYIPVIIILIRNSQNVSFEIKLLLYHFNFNFRSGFPDLNYYKDYLSKKTTLQMACFTSTRGVYQLSLIETCCTLVLHYDQDYMIEQWIEDCPLYIYICLVLWEHSTHNKKLNMRNIF